MEPQGTILNLQIVDRTLLPKMMKVFGALSQCVIMYNRYSFLNFAGGATRDYAQFTNCGQNTSPKNDDGLWSIVTVCNHDVAPIDIVF